MLTQINANIVHMEEDLIHVRNFHGQMKAMEKIASGLESTTT